ncbi:hypothetical protein ILUMI_18060 [Ignelater luminosus]|uniref:Uncharacterized protein n=1 Tax=Ignelater luminosus TaxID=2038154 RepID=A0A8K0CIQ7_IGNLU|nr:hypothetical protein ILUMI_18060 [Ignelater luminosus]
MSYFYYCNTKDGNKVKVCQTFFLNTPSFSHQIVKTVAQKTVTSNTVARGNRERCAKHVSIHVPSQWYVIARTACKEKPYHVKEMDQNDFYDLKDLVANTTKNMEKGSC